MRRYRRSPQIVALGSIPALLNLVGGTALVGAWRFGGPWIYLALGIAILAMGIIGLVAAIGVRYRIDDFELIVSHGPWRTHVPLECIEGVLPTRRHVNFPPVQVDTMTIVYQKDGKPRAMMVCPDDAGEFLRDVASRSPFLELKGDRAIRKPSMTM